MIAAPHAEVARYPNARMIASAATDARPVVGGFSVTLAHRETVTGTKPVLAFGICDVRPDVPRQVNMVRSDAGSRSTHRQAPLGQASDQLDQLRPL